MLKKADVKAIKPCLREMFLKYLECDLVFSRLFVEIEKVYDVIIFGGVVRDYIVFKTFEPRDIDLVLCSNSAKGSLENLLYSYYPESSIRKNQFEGYKLQSAYTFIDIWLLENTWAFRHGLLKASLDNLLRSVCLNIDAYAYHLTNKYFIGNCDEKELPEKIDFSLKENPNIDLNIIRALHLSKKYNIGLSAHLKKTVVNFFNNKKKMEQRVINIQNKHYNRIVISNEEISNILMKEKKDYKDEKYML
jgi:hypothetical protein